VLTVSAKQKKAKSKRQRPAPPPDARVIKAIGHPLRRAILVALNERQASPTQLARCFDEPVNLVAYHTGILAKAGAIELVRTEPRRGSTEHYYRATMRPFFEDREWAKLPLETRRSVFNQDIKRIMADMRQAAADSGFDHPKAHVSWTTMDLDEQGFEEVATLLRGVLDELYEIQARVTSRQLEKGEKKPGPIPAEVAIAQFERRDRRARRRRSER
jgi:DNA-binding transcriptional ArsR family regulator